MPPKTVQLSLNLPEKISELWTRFTQAAVGLARIAIEIGDLLAKADDEPGFDFTALPFNAQSQKIFRNFHARRAELQGCDGEIDHQMMLALMSIPEARKQIEKIAGPGSGQWMAFASPLESLHSWLRKRTEESAIADWPQPVREMLVDRLRPLAALLATLEEMEAGQ